MKYQCFSENQWIYPDTPLTAENTAVLHTPRNGSVSFQILTDFILSGGESFSLSANGLPCKVTAEQLLPAHVGENSADASLTTTDYESVRHFVTRKAPFDVYDLCRPLDSGVMVCSVLEDNPFANRAAFYIRLDIPADASPGTCEGTVTLTFGENQITVPVSLKIYETVIPSLFDASFHMVNWIYYDVLAEQHGVTLWSEDYRRLLEAYLDNQLDMRNDYLMIPSGEPIRDESGKVVDFDFTGAKFVGNLALEKGFKYIMGGFSARFNVWDEPEQYLLWDRSVGVTTIEGYRQLKIYFTRAWECVVKNRWQEHYMQCLVDEPQFPNSLSYRALSGICRSRMPGVKIHDPVETTEIAGAVDVWVVKQAVFEKYLAEYQTLQGMGEEMWLYTCGFPAGATMNRVMDLPLTVSRLPMWMCHLYDCPGFLHWGYHRHNPEAERETCFAAGPGIRYPAGNAHVVYPGDGRPWYSVRGHLQRAGAEDCELFRLLEQKNPGRAKEIIRTVCRTFDDYNSEAQDLETARRQVLELLG